ncbi:hypothetical protein CONLIGDRAFT_647603 [Coniochaeta ligniaria NRRL 30616]|uniref:Glutamyl-tRNA amidotransferase complex subunit Gta3 domain-containing protein n=1 Tax=Coniochaeta ligniaria NRRL 30616 TaxID=1408157 RepID=A0A1J7JE71_9PEZI|nr:hypothetical protein CONLIGDRAFT_647603 [Coniochaeta ligniaria NRRL 30616]
MSSVTSRVGRELYRRSRPARPLWLQCPALRRRCLSSTSQSPADPAAILSRPTWSVRSLLPDDKGADSAEARITPKQLHHLLRLSALPLPKTPEEEAKMIGVLQSQLLFVRDIQSVDTQGVEPLRSIRDETEAGLKEATIGVDELRDALSREVALGRSRRPRRQKHMEKPTPEVEGWDPLHTASQTTGPYFVVRSGKSKDQ